MDVAFDLVVVMRDRDVFYFNRTRLLLRAGLFPMIQAGAHPFCRYPYAEDWEVP